MQWPQDIVQAIVARALEAIGPREAKPEEASPLNALQHSYPYPSKPSPTQTPLSL
jgi:hypothetical protein